MFAKRVMLFLGLLGVGPSYNALHVHAAPAGIYTADQAKRGSAVYQEQCTVCHGEDLNGVGQASPLSGDEFLSKYQGQSIVILFDKIGKTMPATKPGSMTPAQTADVLAYILSSNKYMAGSTELPSDLVAVKKLQLDKP